MTRRSVGSVRQVGKNRWRIQVSAGYDPTTGKRNRKDKTISGTRRDAEDELARMLISAGEVTSARVTVDHFLTQIWLPHMKPPRVRDKTWVNYESKVRKHIVPYLGKLPVDELTPLRLDHWLDQLRAAKVSEHTSLHAYRVLKGALEQGVKWRMIGRNPLDAVEPPKREKHQPSVLTAEEAVALLSGVRGHILEPAVVLAVACGMRRSEICGLKWEDVDLVNGSATILRGRHVVDGRIVEEPPKTERSRRVISLTQHALEPLRRHRQDAGYVVSDENGAPIAPDSLSRRYDTLCKHIGVRRIPFRDLRHTHATLSLQAGVDMVTISRRLGHSNFTTTDNFYLHPGRAADELAAELFDDLLAPTRAKQTDTGVTRLKPSRDRQAG